LTNWFKNNKEEFQLLNSFQKFIFSRQSAVPQNVPLGALRAPLFTPLVIRTVPLISSQSTLSEKAICQQQKHVRSGRFRPTAEF